MGMPNAASGAPHEEVVQFRHGDVALAGTLSLPHRRGPYPAMVFVAGSGPAARDGYTSLPPLWDEFARRGIASLAWDKPGVGASTGDWRTQSLQDRADECVAAIHFLQRREDIDARRIGVWGISQAGWLLPLVCTQCPEVACVIAVSVPASTGAEQELFRIAQGLRADGFSDAETQQALAFTARRLQMLQQDVPFAAITEAQRSVERETWFEPLGWLDEAACQFLKANAFVSPRPVLGALSCPVLLIFGQRDTVVNVHESVRVYSLALRTAGNQDVTVRVFPEADHVIFVSKTGGLKELTASFGASAKPYAPGYLEAMGEWLEQRLHPPACG